MGERDRKFFCPKFDFGQSNYKDDPDLFFSKIINKKNLTCSPIARAAVRFGLGRQLDLVSGWLGVAAHNWIRPCGRQDLGPTRSGWGTARFYRWRPNLAARGHIYFFFNLSLSATTSLVGHLSRALTPTTHKGIFFFIKYSCPYNRMTQIRVRGKNLSLSRVDKKSLA